MLNQIPGLFPEEVESNSKKKMQELLESLGLKPFMDYLSSPMFRYGAMPMMAGWNYAGPSMSWPQTAANAGKTLMPMNMLRQGDKIPGLNFNNPLPRPDYTLGPDNWLDKIPPELLQELWKYLP